MPSSLAPTPPMGWNSWNTFGHDINETVVRETADALVSTGLKDHGYNDDDLEKIAWKNWVRVLRTTWGE